MGFLHSQADFLLSLDSPRGKTPRKASLDKKKVMSRQFCCSVLLGKSPAISLNRL